MKKLSFLSNSRFTSLWLLLIAICLLTGSASYAQIQKKSAPKPKKASSGKPNDSRCRIRSKDITVEADDRPTDPTINANITIYLKNGNTMNFSGANAGSTPYFVSNESYPDGTKYNMTVSGYGRVAVLAFSYTNNRWEYLTEGAGGNGNNGIASKDVKIEDEADGEVELPSDNANGTRRYFTLRGSGHTYEQFLVLLSNTPLDAAKLNMLTNTAANGTAIISEAARIFNSAAPEATYTPGTITNVNITNGGKGAEITPLYFQINRQ